MASEAPGIVILRERITATELVRLVELYFKDMVEYVVDVQRLVIAIGGELHADAEQMLLEDGSRQQDLWGANYYPGAGAERCIEFTALMNIKPTQGNRSMEVSDPRLREQIRNITFELVRSEYRCPPLRTPVQEEAYHAHTDHVPYDRAARVFAGARR